MFSFEFIDVVGTLTFCYSAVPEIKATSVAAEFRCSEVSHYPIFSSFELPECATKLMISMGSGVYQLADQMVR